MSFDWGPIFSAALQGALQFGAEYYKGQRDQDRLKEQRAYDEAHNPSLTFEQQKELKAIGPEAPAPFTGFTDPQRVQAMQNQNAQSMAAIDAIIKAYQTALLGGR